jgi:hypothetical protein
VRELVSEREGRGVAGLRGSVGGGEAKPASLVQCLSSAKELHESIVIQALLVGSLARDGYIASDRGQ